MKAGSVTGVSLTPEFPLGNAFLIPHVPLAD